LLIFDCFSKWHDIAFYWIDTSILSFDLQQANFGDSFALEQQDEVFLIGNNENCEYSVKYGTVSINTIIIYANNNNNYN